LVKLQTLAFTLAAVAGALPALAAPAAQDLLEAVGHCATIADDHTRLACYDALAPRVKDAVAVPPATLPNNRPPSTEEQKSWFGFDLGDLFGAAPAQQTTAAQFGSDKLPATHAKEDTAAAQVDSISAGVTDVAYTPFGKFIVFLDNGQVWRQIEGDSDHAIFRKPAKANKITISRGFIGSYNLTRSRGAAEEKIYHKVSVCRSRTTMDETSASTGTAGFQPAARPGWPRSQQGSFFLEHEEAQRVTAREARNHLRVLGVLGGKTTLRLRGSACHFSVHAVARCMADVAVVETAGSSNSATK
jgi:hypothetical protein